MLVTGLQELAQDRGLAFLNERIVSRRSRSDAHP